MRMKSDITRVMNSPRYAPIPGSDVQLETMQSDGSVVKGAYDYSKDPILRDALRTPDYYFAGWRKGAMLAAVSSSLVFLVNLVVTIWIGVQLKKTASTVHSTVQELYHGNCHDVETTNTWVHLAINVISTVLLSASNYCMQCLSAPTRKELDKAHKNGKWLDIGIPSIRNLKAIGKMKLTVWILLGLSSIPLHLL